MVPADTPAVIAAPTTPEAAHRSDGEKRSATIVVIAGCIELSVIVAITQNVVMITRLLVDGTSARETPPMSDPNRIHGVRRPRRVRVRSESAPATGVAIVLKTEVIA